jgi:HK97 family phage prohead protease
MPGIGAATITVGVDDVLKELIERAQTAPKRSRMCVPLREVRVVSDPKPMLTGHAAVFNVISDAGGRAWFLEQIAPGAFSKTIQEADVRALINHDVNLVLGRTKSNTLRLAEDDIGLLIEADLPPTSYAADLAAVMARGDVDQMSFAFDVVKDEWQYDGPKPLRTIKEVSLQDGDVSVVTFAWYTETDASLTMRKLVDEMRGRIRAGAFGDDERSLLRELSEDLRACAASEPGQAAHSQGAAASEPARTGHSVDLLLRQLATARAKLER